MRAHGMVGLVGLVAAGVAACFSDRTTAGPSANVATVPCAVADVQALGGAGKAVIFMKDFAFHPDTLRVRPGTTVVWVNCDAGRDPHTSTSDAGVWGSDLIAPGSTFSRRFDQAGSFGYHCTPHPFMKGQIAVDASAPDVAGAEGR